MTKRLKEHRGQAQDSHKYHLQCTAKSKQDMDKIQELQKVVNVSEDQREELRVLKHNLKHTEENVIPSREETYENTNRRRQISSTKFGHLQQMYKKFIPQERHDPTIMQ